MDTSREPLQPIFTAQLFPKLEEELIELLQSLAPDDWEKQTLAPKSKVRHVAAHLLDTQIRKLAAARRGYNNDPAGNCLAHFHEGDRTGGSPNSSASRGG